MILLVEAVAAFAATYLLAEILYRWIRAQT